ncbi:aminopeptidase N [Nocardioides mangrovicus]|uniref:Aminopeptidase N n=1 Tax=Nocardioides mangrovicus TaxID=2478913 RepID=A0A3L8P0H7_9ACTN|nr:aminopeptidase N [Nocardioides mangrovicus]RLV48511.1 aminopeptidase N [Nocardioides mangrovicus]
MPSLTQDEARERAALLEVESYTVDLDLDAGETFRCRTTVRFGCRRPGAASFAELAEALEVSAVLNGREVEVTEGRIALPDLGADNTLVVEALMPCGTSGDAMHRYVDPADGATYLCAFLGGDVAHRVFACFDQPDLKASFALSVTAPSGWTVLGNGREIATDDGRRVFSPTPPISTYLFVVCAGPFASVRWEHAGLPFGWHARASLGAALERDAEELRRMTEAYFDHYTGVFDEPYAFDCYDQVMAPGLNWGALETPGCVTFRDEFLSPAPPSVSERRHRAMVVAHEMAHMWFGDLATPVWWEDIWLNESFADYMGFEVAHRHAGLGATLPEFTVGQAWWGRAADRRRSTHPVAPAAGSVRDADAGFEATDQITYAKGNAVVRQLATWMGEAAFLRGVNRYLSSHRFANATLADFLTALDAVSEHDVRSWAEAWLRTTGYDTLRVLREDGGPVLVREGSRPHRVQVALDDEVRWVDVVAARTPLPPAAAVLPDAGGQTYASVRTDPGSWTTLWRDLGSRPLQQRAVLWDAALEMVVTGELAAQGAYDLAAEQLPVEPDPSVWEHVTRRLLRLLASALTIEELPAARGQLAGLARATASPELRTAADRLLARCSTRPEELEALLDGTDDPTLRWLLLTRLAALGALEASRIEDEATRRPSTSAVTGAARTRAALPSVEAKAAAWEVFSADDVDNRVFLAVAEGLWVPEHAELSAPYVERYLREAPDWARRRGQGFAREIGHAFPLQAVTDATVTQLREVLAGDVPSVLARAWNDQLDDLEQWLTVRSQPAL